MICGPHLIVLYSVDKDDDLDETDLDAHLVNEDHD